MTIRQWEDKRPNSNDKVGVVIGRFQPIHSGHVQIIQTALKENDRILLIIGSAKQAATYKNPWSDHDRVSMFTRCMEEGGPLHSPKKIDFISIQDHPYSEGDIAWITEVRIKASSYISAGDNVTLYGCNKDDSTFYLKLFPEWKYLDTGLFSNGINATMVRQILFEEKNIAHLVDSLPKRVYDYVANIWARSDAYHVLKNEYEYNEKQRAMHKQIEELSGHHIPYITVDGVVTYPGGKVLTLKRKNLPGLGLYSMPGGFIKAETLFDGVIRIIAEKTGVHVKKDWCKAERTFDRAGRSLRGHTITHAFRFDIPEEVKIDMTKDRSRYQDQWIDIADLSLYSELFFEDHVHILQEMVK